MIKRTESKSNSKRSDRKHAERNRKRRLTMEGLEDRQLLAVLTEPPLQPAPADLPTFDAPRNVGTVAAFNVVEAESTVDIGTNNSRSTAEFVNLGTGPGQESTIDLSGSLPVNLNPTTVSGFSSDIDVYAFDLRAGDILDVSANGAAGTIAIQGPFTREGLPLAGSPATSVGLTSSVLVGQSNFNSPLQTQGNVTGAMVVPEDGRYFLTVGSFAQTTTYTLGLRTYRPVTESLSFGDAQILYLDWEGAVVDNNIFNQDAAVVGLPTFGFTIIPNLDESLPFLGLEFGNTQIANQISTGVYDDVVRIFEDLTRTGTNGDFEASGAGGDYAVRILNSRDPAHRSWYETNASDPRLTRMLIGGTGLDIGVPGVFGVAESVDVGNFDLSEFGVFALDAFQGGGLGFPIAPTVSEVDATIQFLSSVVAHEAGHTFGMLHTDNTNSIASESDAGGTVLVDAQSLGVGPDGIFGTLDDVLPIFQDDFYAPEVFSGFNRVTASLTHALSSGTVGSPSTITVSGQVFEDANLDGSNVGDAGLAGVTVFADLDQNGVFDGNDISAISGADGSFSFNVVDTAINVVAVRPNGTTATTALTASLTAGAPSTVNFGFNTSATGTGGSGNSTPARTGAVYTDLNGNNQVDAGEGISDVFVFLDLDGDGRPDLGEPNTLSAADGTYGFDFPNTGNFEIVAIAPVGFEFTEPSDGSNTVTFTGALVLGSSDFVVRSSRDFGDAPVSYGTLAANNGASHGIVSGLSIGVAPDRESEGAPSNDANGDDTNGIDDEDGVRLLTPLGPGDVATFEVTVNNTSGSPAFLQGFLDLNRDGDFLDAGEQFATDVAVPNGTSGAIVNLDVNVPADATTGTSYARFRLSQTSGVGATGFVGSGEVEDYSFPILNAARVANDDDLSVSRNTLANTLNVLANDFSTVDNPLTVESVTTTAINDADGNLVNLNTRGIVVISGGGATVDYTPPTGFVGLDRFAYTAVDAFGNRSTAIVNVTVTFQSAVPIAVDDSFEVPQGSVNRALNVLDNDISSTAGGISIISVTPGSSGGSIQIIGGGQSLRYTPLPGFNGTEQFTYSIQDANSQVSSAQVTVNLLPGSQNDDVVDFTVGIFDPVNINTPLTNVQVGDTFLLRVSVEDLDQLDQRAPSSTLGANPEGVASAFLDLLYTDELVAFQSNGINPSFPFDITFGALFSGSENFLQRANANTPGLFDEVGGVQPLLAQQGHAGPVELFTIRMTAISPGVAQFTADPADEAPSETIILNQDSVVTDSQLRLGRTELVILPSSNNFTSAIDDSFPAGIDSLGNAIVNSNVPNRLDLLDNDNLGSTGTIRELGIVTSPTLGSVSIDDNGTPTNLNDDFFTYQPGANVNGLERFTYEIVTEDNVRSTAEVTIALGNLNANALVGIDFALVDQAGNPISSVSVGQTFGVQVDVEDLRSNLESTAVFAAYLDVLYDTDLIRPVAGTPGSEFDFGVQFNEARFNEDAGVGTAARAGIIDEFGTLHDSDTVAGALNPDRLATLFFTAVAAGSATVVGSPADSFPFQDTLLFGRDQPVDVSQIRYDSLTIQVGAAAVGEGEAIQNPTLPQDVNNDGSVSPIDALLIINQMTRSIGAEGEQAGAPLSSQYYLDVNGDSRASAVDALQVINYLARMTSNGSGEGEAVLPITSNLDSEPSGSGAASSDSLFADLGSASKLADFGSDSSSSDAASSSIADTDDSDSDTELLDLLAMDIDQLS